jgi:uncharacterized tellurite resistance protein B-like protein
MSDALKSFIAEVAGAEAPARSFGEEDYRLAAVALLIHVAKYRVMVVCGRGDP